MTQEEKAKRYDEAIEKAGKIHNEHKAQPFDVMLKVFPELKESEDERIRKKLIEAVKGDMVVGSTKDKQRAIAWLEKQAEHANFRNKIQIGDKVTRNRDGVLVNLSQLNRVAKKDEKQGEQKPADKVEPKFHEGDWIIHQGTENIYQVVAIIDNQYQLKYGDNYTTQYCENVDRCTRLWDVAKDAKDGDILFQDLMGGKTFIYNGINHNMAILYSFIISNDGKDVLPYHIGKPNTGIGNIEENKNIIHPATKEQRDLLFQKMKEAGYMWDAEKKELKKIEQKPAWSEEDERIISKILGICEDFKMSFEISQASSKIVREDIDKINNWLKSIKYRVQLKPKWKPSDEQMEALANALSLAKNCGEEYSFDLRTLYEQLEKLK